MVCYLEGVCRDGHGGGQARGGSVPVGAESMAGTVSRRCLCCQCDAQGRYGGQLDVEGSDGTVALDGPTGQDLLRPAVGGALCLVFRAGPLRPCLRLGLCCGAHGQSLSAAKAPWCGDGETVGGGHCHGPVLLVAV